MHIAIIDDHNLVAESLKSLILQAYPDAEISTYASPAGFKESCLPHHMPDVIFCDVLMQGSNGIHFLAELRASHDHSIKIIMMSSITDVHTVKDAIKKGANGYISKDANKDELAKAISTVQTGEKFINETLQQKLLKHMFAEDEISLHLSAREHEILQMICKGSIPKEIAAEMKLSIHTVQAYIRNIMQKFKVNRTTDLVVFAIQQGLYYPNNV